MLYHLIFCSFPLFVLVCYLVIKYLSTYLHCLLRLTSDSLPSLCGWMPPSGSRPPTSPPSWSRLIAWGSPWPGPGTCYPCTCTPPCSTTFKFLSSVSSPPSMKLVEPLSFSRTTLSSITPFSILGLLARFHPTVCVRAKMVQRTAGLSSVAQCKMTPISVVTGLTRQRWRSFSPAFLTEKWPLSCTGVLLPKFLGIWLKENMTLQSISLMYDRAVWPLPQVFLLFLYFFLYFYFLLFFISYFLTSSLFVPRNSWNSPAMCCYILLYNLELRIIAGWLRDWRKQEGLLFHYLPPPLYFSLSLSPRSPLERQYWWSKELTVDVPGEKKQNPHKPSPLKRRGNTSDGLVHAHSSEHHNLYHIANIATHTARSTWDTDTSV